ncbi:unnamed protein product, partial [Prunus brigantina]
ERVLTRINWKVCRALARVLAPPPSRYLVLHGDDWWFVHLHSWNFSLLVVAVWSFSLVVAAAKIYVFYV